LFIHRGLSRGRLLVFVNLRLRRFARRLWSQDV
jgi:hypothetical protein